MQDTKWIILNKEIPKTQDKLIEILLNNRLKNVNDIKNFITPQHPKDYIKQNDEFVKVANNAKKASATLLKAIKHNKKVVIYGDYDVDGVTSTAIIWRTIYNKLNYKNVEPFIPNRFEDGYGLSKKAIETLAETECEVIITVDCGIVSIEEVKYAKRLGLEIIISDHHQPEETLPPADIIVHSTNATGAGIAWIIAHELLEMSKTKDDSYLLGLASMGTIADLQPLLGFNRSIVYHGLKDLNNNPPIGIKKLCIEAGIEDTKIETYHIGWQIGPRLNATGRLKDAMDSLRILCTDSDAQATKLAKEINEINKTRQTQTQNGCEIAINEMGNKETPPIIITASRNYHDGIIGLIAGRLMQTYNRPSIAIAIDIDNENNIAKGSARSVKQVNLIETLRKHKDLFETLGGHPMAAGFSIKVKNIDILNKRLLEDLKNITFEKKIKVDLTLPMDLITEETVNTINQLRPFGIGNQSPIFISSDFNIYNMQTFGKENNHLKLFLTKDSRKITAVGFGLGNIAKKLNIGGKADIIYQIVINEWNNIKNVELRIKDLKVKDQ